MFLLYIFHINIILCPKEKRFSTKFFVAIDGGRYRESAVLVDAGWMRETQLDLIVVKSIDF
jgi:hypothetical protein